MENNLSTLLKEFRKLERVSQFYCSRVIGCDLRTYRRWEYGETKPMKIYFKKIEAMLTPKIGQMPTNI